MGLWNLAIHYVAPMFIVTSPLTSYADQIRNIHVTKSSRGFSLDTPLIMLLASVLRCFYWLGANFEKSLLYQSMIMIVVQLTLLKVALDNRPAHDASVPFAAIKKEDVRPFSFWQWRNQRPYWEFLAYFFSAFTFLQIFFGSSQTFIDLTGYLSLGIEAVLPLPQVLENQRSRSCSGFRLSVLASWILGDVMKQVFFFSSEHVGNEFKICAGLQMMLDMYLGVQFFMFGNG
ncbi:hypothetical protein BJ508DRAFT_185092, partial [Ascobolus immersus RN42]